MPLYQHTRRLEKENNRMKAVLGVLPDSYERNSRETGIVNAGGRPPWIAINAHPLMNPERSKGCAHNYPNRENWVMF